MGSVAIIGASRGIGLGFARSYTQDGWEVHATTRNLENPGELGKTKGNISLYQLEVRDHQQILELEVQFCDRGLDLLIHNAGVYGNSLGYEDVMAINSEAPFNVIKALFPAVLRSKTKKIAILTSQMGARNGGTTPSGIYGKSKCALNDRFREIELSWRSCGITAVVFHPGWVATDMGGHGAPVSVEESVVGMRAQIELMTPKNSGSFLTWKGDRHPW